MKKIDVNAAWGFWPIQHFSIKTLTELDEAYKDAGVEEVWLSAVESILYPEPDTYDDALFEQIRSLRRFRPVKTVNPLLANWKKSLEAFRARHPVVAIKLFPNYHGYSLDLPQVTEVAQYAAQHNLPLLIQVRVNDERNQPICMQVDGVSVQAIVELSLRVSDCRIIALNTYRGELPTLAAGSSNLTAEPGFWDGIGVMDFAVQTLGSERLMWGTGAPFLHIQAAVLKLEYWKPSQKH